MTLPLDHTAAWMRAAASAIDEKADYLTELDSAIGDADHGINMRRGFREVAALDPADFADAAAYLKKVGMTLVSKVGGASGPLYGTFFLHFSGAIGKVEPADDAAAAFAAGLEAGLDGRREGVDHRLVAGGGFPALDDAAEAAKAHVGADMWDALVAAAEEGAQSTVPLVARKGRAVYVGERAIGTMDPGAASATLILRAAKEAFAQ